ncbi:DUF6214 family protein [Streptomyces naphthomycinicus]|uniref:DUF6214 family protein n=1 Tax=Streptomyces naphthomycinicus TaxID=2872625 RepID=UPI001CEDD254|nr:DUF6214 family protein [Streptomyces sp. TML10]
MWPAWEVRECDGVTSWLHVRLAFPDGARVDALAVLNGGHVSIEDVNAEPALSLTDLTVLAGWIAGPLFETCGVTPTGAGRADRDASEAGCAGQVLGDAGRVDAALGEAGRAGEVLGEAGRVGEALGEAGCVEEALGEAGDAGEAAGGGGDCSAAGGPDPGAGPPVPRRARHRAAWPRGIEGRRLVAREYRAAQGLGADPVLAVMDATGHSRRRALRLIAQARDAGFLAPRHVRR